MVWISSTGTPSGIHSAPCNAAAAAPAMMAVRPDHSHAARMRNPRESSACFGA